MSQKVLITGGAGFIGCTLAAQLVNAGDEVVAFDNLHPQVHKDFGLPPRLPPQVRFVPGDVTVASNLAALFKFFRPDVVVHLAAETGTGQSLTEAGRHAAVNTLGTANLTDALSAAGHTPRLFVLASSRAVYGDGAWRDEGGTVFYPEGRTRADLEQHRWDFRGPGGAPAVALPHDAAVTRPNPISVYGATKLSQEHMLAAWTRAFGSSLAVLRLQNVYGPGQAPHNAYTGILTLFTRLSREGTALDVYEDGAIVRDFVHVTDVARAIKLAIDRQQAGSLLCDIGSGHATTILEVAKKLAAAFGAPAPAVSQRFRDGDVRAASASIATARSLLGYEPLVGLDEGLATLAGAAAQKETRR